MSEIKIKVDKILVPKDEFLHCDVVGCKCYRVVCHSCERRNPKREILLRDKNNLRKETDAELKERIGVWKIKMEEYDPWVPWEARM